MAPSFRAPKGNFATGRDLPTRTTKNDGNTQLLYVQARQPSFEQLALACTPSFKEYRCVHCPHRLTYLWISPKCRLRPRPSPEMLRGKVVRCDRLKVTSQLVNPYAHHMWSIPGAHAGRTRVYLAGTRARVVGIAMST